LKKKIKLDEFNEASISTLKSFLEKSKETDFEKIQLHNITMPVSLNIIELYHASVYVAGRYTKLARNISNSVWIISGKKVTEDSIDEMIAQTIITYFKPSDHKFISAGREDSDVRMLGKGRPFILEMINPHRLIRNKKQFEEIEKQINNSWHDVMMVYNLQQAPKLSLNKLKEGEQSKSKIYRCVIFLPKEISQTDLDFLKTIKNLTVEQRTPIRVLHRRSLSSRKKVIYNLSATKINNHFLLLDIKAQAGTYIKEFIHGDLGRTKPNFSELMNCNVDIMQLDVLEVELEWP